VLDSHYDVLRDADLKFKNWYATWDQAFSQKYTDASRQHLSNSQEQCTDKRISLAAFYRQSLQVQHLHAELFHNATALRGINGPEDVEQMPPKQQELALKSMKIAQQGLTMTLNSDSYRENMKYAVHYTHATATFMGSFLLRLSRLFPNECDAALVRGLVENLAALMAEIPGQRYALTLQVMLKRSRKRKHHSNSRSPMSIPRENVRPGFSIDHATSVIAPNTSGMLPHRNSEQQPHYGQYPAADPQAYNGIPATQHHYQPHHQQQAHGAHPPQHAHSHPHGHQHQQTHPYMAHPIHYAQYNGGVADAEHIVQDYRMTSNEQLPVWISDQTLGGNSFLQNGMDAFLLPTDYMPPVPQIW